MPDIEIHTVQSSRHDPLVPGHLLLLRLMPCLATSLIHRTHHLQLKTGSKGLPRATSEGLGSSLHWLSPLTSPRRIHFVWCGLVPSVPIRVPPFWPVPHFWPKFCPSFKAHFHQNHTNDFPAHFPMITKHSLFPSLKATWEGRLRTWATHYKVMVFLFIVVESRDSIDSLMKLFSENCIYVYICVYM